MSGLDEPGGLELSTLATAAASVLVLVGAAFTLVGSLGLVRLSTFYERVHAPTLGTTLGTGCIAAASMVYFSALQTRPVVHELLIVLFVIVTTPVTLMILARAALFRDRSEGTPEAPGRREADA
jgi:multicomponent K+:H+ antiporter subunit G